MIVMEKKPELEVRSRQVNELRVERTEILFNELDEDTLWVGVMVHNAGEQPSQPTVMKLESAPLGAFVPWQPLARLLVPALEPGETRELSTQVARRRPIPLGAFNRVPPRKLLAAVSSPDQPSPTRTGVTALFNLLRRGPRTGSAAGDVARKGFLAPDLWDWMDRGQPHWAGNINVFIGRHSVERHLARALRIFPGRTNLAMFIVGSPGKPDAFAFEILGLNPDWKAGLYDVSSGRSLVPDFADAPIREKQWVESSGGLVVLLATRPPVGCPAGNVEVHVTRRSGRKTAIVEFNLDPAAQGSGCYSV